MKVEWKIHVPTDIVFPYYDIIFVFRKILSQNDKKVTKREKNGGKIDRTD